jgi:hypothetical protein
MATKIKIIKAKSIQENLEDIMDHFDFIKCYGIEFDRLREILNTNPSNLRIRDLKKKASQALKNVIAEAQELESLGANKFNKLIKCQNGNFLALGEWQEQYDLPTNWDDEEPKEITRYEERLYLALYYFPESWDTL